MIGIEFRMYYDLGDRGYCILYYYIILYSEMITGSLTLYNVNKLAKKIVLSVHRV